MIRISKMTDYATVILAAMAEKPATRHTATALAARTQIGSASVSKVLKQLQRAGFVRSTRGLHGGYELARPADAISAASILDALEGPVAVTDCAAGEGQCDIETTCRVGRAWQRVNLAIRRSLYGVTLAQLAGLDGASLRLPPIERGLGSRSPGPPPR
jgi:FeS assembly SUF system regulator